MNRAKIGIYIQALDRLLFKEQEEFSDFRAFNHYKKQQIHAYRNQLLARFLGCNEDQLQFSKHEHGKPFLSSHPLHFNHSHSQQDYVLAVSSTVQDIGVDIESLDRKIRFEALAKHAFHPDEYQIWQDTQNKEYWFKVWTTKEAVLKASGLGIRLDLNSLNTQVHPFNNGGMCSHPMVGIFAYQNFILNHQIVVTVAWRSTQSCKGFQFPQIRLHSF